MIRATLRRVVCLLPLLALVVMCASCSDFWVSDSSIATVTVSPNSLILKAGTGGTTPVAGDKYTLSASGTTVGGTTSDETAAATWTSSAPSVATAGTGGVVTVVATTADQTSVITASFGGQTSTCNVLTYTGTAPSGSSAITIELPNGLSNTVSAGQTFQLKASTSLSGNTSHDISNYVTWASNNPATATISSTGLVTVLSTASAGGNFTITATATFASDTASGTSGTFSLPSI